MAEPNVVTCDLVKPIAKSFAAIARDDWGLAAKELTKAMHDHARLGGSRAQRDLLEFALLGSLLRMGKHDEAKRLLALRRPALAGTQYFHGMDAHISAA